MRLSDFFLVLPTFVLALILAPIILDIIGADAEFLGIRATLIVIVIVIGITSWATTARIIRSQVLSVKERMFVDRARVIGCGSGRIMRRHILPNVVNLIVAQAVLTFATAVFTETTLAFIGLGDPFAPVVGRDPELRPGGRRARPRRLVVHRSAGALRRPRRPRLHARRQRPRRHPEPEDRAAPVSRRRHATRRVPNGSEHALQLRERELATGPSDEADAARAARQDAATESRPPRRSSRTPSGGRRPWPLPKQADPAAPLLEVRDLKTYFSLDTARSRRSTA